MDLSKTLERVRREQEARRATEEEQVRWQRHLQDIAEGKDSAKEIENLKNEVKELKEKLAKYENNQ